jgi:NAD/NADP transhydrogenase alpha subunit
MRVGVPKESLPGETRVAIIPAAVPGLIKAGLEVLVEQGAGTAAGFPDAEQAVIGFADPLGAPAAIRDAAATGATLLSMELMPRITRAQSMDALSSMATIAGYKAVLLAADALPRMFPMLMTAAGTISPRQGLRRRRGVAGLQAIATARRLGAKVEAYDVRPAVKEQVQSLGAKFVELPLETRPTPRTRGATRRRRTSRSTAAARDDAQGRGQQRRRDHHGAHPGQEGADAHHHGDGRGHGARLGGRRPGGRARRQLRADAARRGRRPQGRDDPRALQPAGERALPREPDVLEEHHSRS